LRGCGSCYEKNSVYAKSLKVARSRNNANERKNNTDAKKNNADAKKNNADAKKPRNSQTHRDH
jgi:sRNA-binding protein